MSNNLSGSGFNPNINNPNIQPAQNVQAAAGNYSQQTKESAKQIKLSPEQLASRLSQLLQGAKNDPKIAAMLAGMQINANQLQHLATSIFVLIKDLFGKKLNLSKEEEEEILKAILREYEADRNDANELIDPDERNNRKQKRKDQKKDKVNSVMFLIEQTLETLHSKGEMPSGINFES